MVVIVTRDVADRFRGFLASAMLEIAPGVYASPRLTAAVRERIWTVLESWYQALGGGSVVMTWRDRKEPCGQGIRTLGAPPRRFAAIDGLVTTVATVDKSGTEAQSPGRSLAIELDQGFTP